MTPSRRLREECTHLAQWWLHEMREVAADLEQRWAPGKAQRTTLYLTPLLGRIEQRWRDGRVQSTEFAPAAAGIPVASDTSIHVVLPESDVLIRRIRLPAAAERNIAAVIELQLARELPVARDQVHVDWRIEARSPDGSKIDVAIAMVRSSEIARIMDATSEWKLRVLSISVAIEADRTAFNFAPRRSARAIGQLTTIDRRLMVSAAVLTILHVALVGAQWFTERSIVGKALAAANIPAQRVEHMQAQLAEQRKPLAVLSALMQSPSSAAVLTDLTATIPTDTWLPQLEIQIRDNDATLTLTAITPTATLLMDRLESAPRVAEIKLRSSSPAGLAERDRIELSARWTP